MSRPNRRRPAAPAVSTVKTDSTGGLARFFPAAFAFGFAATLVPILVSAPEGAIREGDFNPVALPFLLFAAVVSVAALRRPRLSGDATDKTVKTVVFSPKTGELARRAVRVADAALALFLAWATVSYLALVLGKTGDVRFATNAYWCFATPPLLYFFARRFRRDFDSRLISNVFVLIFAVAAAESLHSFYSLTVSTPRLRAAYLADPEGVLAENGISFSSEAERARFENRLLESSEPTGTFGLANTLAGLLAPTLVFGAAAFVSAVRRRRAAKTADGKIDAIDSPQSPNIPNNETARLPVPSVATLAVWAAALLLVLFVLLATKSRSGFLGATFGVGVWGVLSFLAALRRAERKTARRVAFGTVGAFVGAALLLVGAFATGLLDREVFAEAGKSLGYRLDYWRSTAAMIADSPLLGVGPGEFQNVYARYIAPTASEFIADPHSFAFELAALFGVPALAAFVVFLAALATAAVATVLNVATDKIETLDKTRDASPAAATALNVATDKIETLDKTRDASHAVATALNVATDKIKTPGKTRDASHAAATALNVATDKIKTLAANQPNPNNQPNQNVKTGGDVPFVGGAIFGVFLASAASLFQTAPLDGAFLGSTFGAFALIFSAVVRDRFRVVPSSAALLGALAAAFLNLCAAGGIGYPALSFPIFLGAAFLVSQAETAAKATQNAASDSTRNAQIAAVANSTQNAQPADVAKSTQRAHPAAVASSTRNVQPADVANSTRLAETAQTPNSPRPTEAAQTARPPRRPVAVSLCFALGAVAVAAVFDSTAFRPWAAEFLFSLRISAPDGPARFRDVLESGDPSKIDAASHEVVSQCYYFAGKAFATRPTPENRARWERLRTQAEAVSPNSASLREGWGDFDAALFADATRRERREFLDSAVDFYRQAVDRSPTDAAKRAKLAAALRDAATLPAPPAADSPIPPLAPDAALADARRQAEIALELDAKTPHLDRKLPDATRDALRRFLETAR